MQTGELAELAAVSAAQSRQRHVRLGPGGAAPQPGERLGPSPPAERPRASPKRTRDPKRGRLMAEIYHPSLRIFPPPPAAGTLVPPLLLACPPSRPPGAGPGPAGPGGGGGPRGGAGARAWRWRGVGGARRRPGAAGPVPGSAGSGSTPRRPGSGAWRPVPGADGRNTSPAWLVVSGQAGYAVATTPGSGHARAAHRPGARAGPPAAAAQPVPQRGVDGGGSSTRRAAGPGRGLRARRGPAIQDRLRLG